MKDFPPHVTCSRDIASPVGPLVLFFEKRRKSFEIDFDRRGTEFQLSVWQELARIPFGTTCKYGDIAKRLDKPGTMRAAGLANGNNPISIIVPCHRVIGANGSLTGFGGGLPTKREASRPGRCPAGYSMTHLTRK